MHAITSILAGYLSAIEGHPVETSEIEAMADRCDRSEVSQILERLAPSIPTNKILEATQMTEPVGYNRKRAVCVMGEHNLDLLIAASPVNVFYLSGLPLLHCAQNPILLALNNQYPNLAMIRREGEGTLIHWGVFRSAGRFSWMPDAVGIESQEECKQAVMAKIRQWGLAGKRVGVESTAPAYLLDALASAGCAVTIPADQAFLDMRLVKSPLECEYLEKAAWITEEALQRTIEAVREGVTDLELLKIGRDAMLAAGADDWDHLTLTIGDSDPEAPGTGRAVKAGEIVRLDFGAIYRGYVADVNQHVCVGPAPEKAKELIAGLLEYQKKFEDAIAPGVNMKKLGEDVLAWYAENYPHGEANASAAEAFTIGHSIGLQGEDQHISGALGALDRPFEPNMVFEIEAWQEYAGALIGVEDAYVVTETGCRKLTTMEKTIIEV
jgi:Xaa-Pro aminopeptidase/Xaa-Pro dipeptidase